MLDESDRLARFRVRLAAKRDRKALIGAKLPIGRQPRACEPEASVEPVMVRAGSMNRTWAEWGFSNGTDGSGPRLLLKALQARAAGIALVELSGCGGEAVAQLSAQINKLVARTRLCEARLADELDHDIKLWEWHWETLRRYLKPKAGGGNSNIRTATSAPLSRATAGPVGGGAAAQQGGRRIGSEAVVKRFPAVDKAADDGPVTRQQFVDARDPLRLLVQWAQWKYGSADLPARSQLLADHREQFGKLRRINELTFRKVRKKLAPETAKLGGAPTHRLSKIT